MNKKAPKAPALKYVKKHDPEIEMGSDDAVEKAWETFWLPLFGGKSPTEQQIKQELAGYYFILVNVPIVYETVTGFKLSKPNYPANTVIAAFYEYVKSMTKELYLEIYEDVKPMATDGKIDLSELAEYLEIPEEKR